MVPNCLSQERLMKVHTSDDNGEGGEELKYSRFLSNFIGLKKKHYVMVNPFLVLNNIILNLVVVKDRNLMKPGLPYNIEIKIVL